MDFNHRDSRDTIAESYNTRAEGLHQNQQTTSEGSKNRLPRKSSQSSEVLIPSKGVSIFIR